jgi:hypothetical protein
MAKLGIAFIWVLLMNAGLVMAGTIHTIAGDPNLDLQQDGLAATDAATTFPQNVALDAAGNILFVELETSRLRRIDVSSGLVVTISGTGRKTYGGDGGAGIAGGPQQPDGPGHRPQRKHLRRRPVQ